MKSTEVKYKVSRFDDFLSACFLFEDRDMIRQTIRDYYRNFQTKEEEKQMEREYNK